jgi:hypothetical protein
MQNNNAVLSLSCSEDKKSPAEENSTEGLFCPPSGEAFPATRVFAVI